MHKSRRKQSNGDSVNRDSVSCTPAVADTADQQQVCRELFLKRRDELQEDMRSMSDEFDKAILTLSSGGLALSLGFLKDFAGPREIYTLPLLYASWAAFLIAILATVFSYPLSRSAMERALTDAKEYYLNGKEEYFDRKNPYTASVKWLGVTAASSFVLAIALTSIFIGVSVQARSKNMSKSSNTNWTTDGRTPLSAVEKPDLTRGRVPSMMVPSPYIPDVNTGRIAPGMVPKPSAPQAPAAPSKPAENKKTD